MCSAPRQYYGSCPPLPRVQCGPRADVLVNKTFIAPQPNKPCSPASSPFLLGREGSLVCRATKWVIQGEMLLVTPPTDLAAGVGSSLVPVVATLDSNLICPWTCLLATLVRRALAQLLALSPWKSVQPCAQPGLLEHKHGLRVVLGGQVEAVCEVKYSRRRKA